MLNNISIGFFPKTLAVSSIFFDILWKLLSIFVCAIVKKRTTYAKHRINILPVKKVFIFKFKLTLKKLIKKLSKYVNGMSIPLMSLSILLSLVLIFIEIIKELSATLILRPFNFNTLAIQVYEYASEEKIIESSIPSLIIVVLCVIGIIFMSRINNQLLKSDKRQ